VKTWPVSTHIEAAVSRSTAWFTLTDGNSVTVAGGGARHGVTVPSWAH
jgi:hypothetical protein